MAIKSLSKAGENLNRIKNYKVWQDGFHPVELTDTKILEQKLDYLNFSKEGLRCSFQIEFGSVIEN